MGALKVSAGILLSRAAGFVRESIFAYYLGNSQAADVFRAAMRIPNLLQNLLGEGVLSASFIPSYSKLVERDPEQARLLAFRVWEILVVTVVLVAALGILGSQFLVDLIVPGFSGEKREKAIELVRVLFPGAAILVLSAWCLGILNSHRRFLLSYSAPVFWNLAIIATLLYFGGRGSQYELIDWLAWGVVVGSLFQLLVQLPSVLRLTQGYSPSWRRKVPEAVAVFKNSLVVMIGRGVAQISAFVDSMIASFLPHGALAALGYAQILYLLPISLFGMAISAAELPELSRLTTAETAGAVLPRLKKGVARLSFFVIPSAIFFIFAGDMIIGPLFERGAFDADDTWYVWGTLSVLAVALLPSSWSRLLSSYFYAVQDTKTPLRCAVVRIILSAGLGAVLAIYGPDYLGVDRRWGLLGLAGAAAFASWVEYFMLYLSLPLNLKQGLVSAGHLRKILISASLGVTAVFLIRMVLVDSQLAQSLCGVVAYGAAFVFAALLLKIPEANDLLRHLGRRK